MVSLTDARLRPVPVQQPRPPIWIGGTGPRRTLPLVARYADVWHAFGTPKSLHDAARRVDELAVEAGREYYRFAAVGGLTGGQPLSGEWSLFVLQVDDLPSAAIE